MVRVLLPLRVPPPAVVLAGTAVGLWAAWLLWSRLARRGRRVLLQLKTLLDGADGQLARASGRVTVLGRYLDSESDLLVDAFLFAALGHVTGLWVLAVVAFFVLALVLSFDFGLELAWRRELGVAPREARPRGFRARGRVRADLRRRLRAAGPARRPGRGAAAAGRLAGGAAAVSRPRDAAGARELRALDAAHGAWALSGGRRAGGVPVVRARVRSHGRRCSCCGGRDA